VDFEKNTQKTGFWRKAFVVMTCSRFFQGIIGYKMPFLYLLYPSLTKCHLFEIAFHRSRRWVECDIFQNYFF